MRVSPEGAIATAAPCSKWRWIEAPPKSPFTSVCPRLVCPVPGTLGWEPSPMGAATMWSFHCSETR